MNGNRIALSFIAIIVFTGLGCRQESPGAPPAAPTPKTSSAPSDPIAAAPATAAQNEKTNSDPGITTGSNVEDAVVTGKVRAALLGNEDVRATEINVETQKGVVQLSGVVQTNSDLDRAVYLAKQVEGVKEVQNRLRVKPS
jgi:hyperosmotically inducible protein